MKSERRHKLQTNTLSSTLENLPNLLKLHANKILMGVVVIALLGFLIRYRTSSADQRRVQLQDSMASIRSGLVELGNLDRTRPDPAQLIAGRKQLATDINAAVESIVQGTDEDQVGLRAEAMLARGDLYWALANAPAMPGAATQPALQFPESASSLLDKAQAAYQQVVDSASNQVFSRVAAQFGLAAVAENKRDFDQAGKIYKTIAEGPDVPDFYKVVAQQKLVMLPEIRQPVFIGALNVESTTQPTTLPMYIAAPGTRPGTLPTTMP